MSHHQIQHHIQHTHLFRETGQGGCSLCASGISEGRKSRHLRVSCSCYDLMLSIFTLPGLLVRLTRLKNTTHRPWMILSRGGRTFWRGKGLVRVLQPLLILILIHAPILGCLPAVDVIRNSDRKLQFPEVTEEVSMRMVAHSFILEKFSMYKTFDIILSHYF